VINRRGGRFDSERARASYAQGYSSTGRASVSKTEGWGFDSLCPCQID
jgi:hypothetical protein